MPIRIEDRELKTLTPNYPEEFSDFGKDSVDVDDAKIQDWIDQISYTLRTTDDEKCVIASGNTVVIGLKYREEIQIIVAKNYHTKSMFPDITEKVGRIRTVEW